MSIEEHDTVDFVAHDPAQDRVLLVMVAGGSWEDDGSRLPDLQSKLNAYLMYEEQQLWDENPALKGKPVTFQLAAEEPPGEQELAFLQLAVNRVLGPSGIRMTWKKVGLEIEHEIAPSVEIDE